MSEELRAKETDWKEARRTLLNKHVKEGALGYAANCCTRADWLIDALKERIAELEQKEVPSE